MFLSYFNPDIVNGLTFAVLLTIIIQFYPTFNDY
jgi:hypothetical protein